MPDKSPTAFISYAREDSEFALRLARDLKHAGANVWIDQLDIRPGAPWDNAIEDALLDAPFMLVVLSPTSVRSDNVRDEISYALKQGKIVVPVMYMDCVVPLRLERKQHIDFRSGYAQGLGTLLDHLRIAHPNQDVLDQAAEDEAVRKAAWQAREAEARRLADLNQRERRQEATRLQEKADGIAIEDAERRARDESERKSRVNSLGHSHSTNKHSAFADVGRRTGVGVRFIVGSFAPPAWLRRLWRHSLAGKVAAVLLYAAALCGLAILWGFLGEWEREYLYDYYDYLTWLNVPLVLGAVVGLRLLVRILRKWLQL
jgi:hypothetical protein